MLCRAGSKRVECFFKAAELLIVNRHTFAKTPVLGKVALHKFPGESLAALAKSRKVAAVRLRAHALVFEGIRMQFVRAAAEGDAARFVVGRHNNQRFVGVLAVELVCHANGFVKIFHFMEHRGGIVAVASPVNLAAFHH